MIDIKAIREAELAHIAFSQGYVEVPLSTRTSASIVALCDEVERMTTIASELQDLCDRQAKRLAEVEEDAASQFKDVERYWFLRDMDHWPAVFTSSNAPEPLRGKGLDAAIDAAMEAKQ